MSAESLSNPADKSPCLIVATREGNKPTGLGGRPALTWSFGTVNGPMEEDNGIETWREGLATNSTEGRMEPPEALSPETEEGELRPLGGVEWEETSKSSPTDPKESTLH